MTGGSDTAQHISVVLGSHRTGTSAVSRLMGLLGVSLGPEERLIGPIEGDNPKGFYEHKQLMLVSDALLERHNGTWRNPPELGPDWELAPELDDLLGRARRLIARDFSGAERWGFKDPRLSLTLPFWRRVITPTAHVICCRNPLEVARSMGWRNRIPLEHGIALWLHYTAHAIVTTRREARLFVGYEELFADRPKLIADLAAFLGVPDRSQDPKVAAGLDAWIDPELRHHESAAAELRTHRAVSPQARELWELLQMAVRTRGTATTDALDTVAQRIASGPPPRERRRVPVGPARRPLRVVAMLQVYNERRFLGGCIEHLREQGVDVYIIDNESTDETLDIAERYLNHGVIGIETLARDDCFALRVQCARQEELAQTLDADWLIHYDADEIRTSPKPGQTLAEAIAEFHEAGFNAVNFLELAFVPTREFPDHDHPHFQQTMRWYYPFLPRFPHRCNAWRRQDGPVDLKTEAGHRVTFPGLNMAPTSLYMRHYLYISLEHALDKFVHRQFATDEVADGWFGWRSRLSAEMIELPSVTDLRHFVADHLVDPSEPLKRHLLEAHVPPAPKPAPERAPAQ